jgi:hypothetical protein
LKKKCNFFISVTYCVLVINCGAASAVEAARGAAAQGGSSGELDFIPGAAWESGSVRCCRQRERGRAEDTVCKCSEPLGARRLTARMRRSVRWKATRAAKGQLRTGGGALLVPPLVVGERFLWTLRQRTQGCIYFRDSIFKPPWQKKLTFWITYVAGCSRLKMNLILS